MKSNILFFTLSLLLLGCQGEKANRAAPSSPDTDQKKNSYTLEAFSESPDFPDASIDGWTYSEGTFKFDVSKYDLGEQTSDAETKMCANSGKGQHIHLIVDDSPYAAKYVPEFVHEVADGEHYILSFLSRSYHESVKTAAAHSAEKVQVENKSLTGREKITEPMLFYSRPKGTYLGADTKRVMLDFFLVNTDLKNGNKVVADINGEVHEITEWLPHYIDGLPIGKNKITLTLVDKDGNRIDAPLNPVSREFELKADPLDGAK